MRHQILLSICGLAIAALSAQAFELTSTPSESLAPVREILPDENGVTVSYTFPGAVVSEDDLYPGTFHLDIPGFGVNMTPVEAEWPQRWDSFVIPQGFEPSVELLSASTETRHFHLAPARPDLPNSSDETYSRENVPPVTAFSGQMPAGNIERGDIKIYRQTYPLCKSYAREISIHSLDNAKYDIYDCKQNDDCIEINKIGQHNDIYIIDLIQNGIIVDSRKIILK